MSSMFVVKISMIFMNDDGFRLSIPFILLVLELIINFYHELMLA